MGNGKFQSPIKLVAENFSGSYRLGPIRNDQTIYFRVQAVSDGNKFSSGDPVALGQAPKSFANESSDCRGCVGLAFETAP